MTRNTFILGARITLPEIIELLKQDKDSEIFTARFTQYQQEFLNALKESGDEFADAEMRKTQEMKYICYEFLVDCNWTNVTVDGLYIFRLTREQYNAFGFDQADGLEFFIGMKCGSLETDEKLPVLLTLPSAVKAAYIALQNSSIYTPSEIKESHKFFSTYYKHYPFIYPHLDSGDDSEVTIKVSETEYDDKVEKLLQTKPDLEQLLERDLCILVVQNDCS